MPGVAGGLALASRLPLVLWRVARLVLHVLHGMAVMALRFPSLDAAGRQARIQWWSAGLLRAIGVGLQVQGTPRPGATLLVANHVSWLDIAALHAAVPQARFVSKADVRRWPLLGWLVAGAGTLFIERERKRDALRVVHAMADALRAGETVAVFPEGTTGPGPALLPFHANLIQAAISAHAPAQPVALQFIDGASGQPSLAPIYVDDQTLVGSVWRTLTTPGLRAVVRYGQPQPSGGRERRAWAAELRAAVSALRDA